MFLGPNEVSTVRIPYVNDELFMQAKHTRL